MPRKKHLGRYPSDQGHMTVQCPCSDDAIDEIGASIIADGCFPVDIKCQHGNMDVRFSCPPSVKASDLRKGIKDACKAVRDPSLSGPRRGRPPSQKSLVDCSFSCPSDNYVSFSVWPRKGQTAKAACDSKFKRLMRGNTAGCKPVVSRYINGLGTIELPKKLPKVRIIQEK